MIPDEAAFLRIFDEHRQAVFRFAYRLTASRADAEDVTQETFLALLRPGFGYDSARGSLRTYLLGIARNHALKRLLKRGVAGEVDEQVSSAVSPEFELLSGEVADAVERAVMRLPETQRAVVVLAHYEQLALAEIAAAMDLDVGAVKSRLQRGRGALKEMLAAYAPGVERRR